MIRAENKRVAQPQMKAQSARGINLPCENCGKAFPFDQLMDHEGSCRATRTATSNGSMASSRSKAPSGSVSQAASSTNAVVPCYICGKDFAGKALGVHEGQCLKKWEIDNNKLPRELRRPKPQKTATVQLETNSYREPALEQCHNCGDDFQADRLAAHQKTCKPKSTVQSKAGKNSEKDKIVKADTKLINAYEDEFDYMPIPVLAKEKSTLNIAPTGTVKLKECAVCGRNFAADRLDTHKKICKQTSKKRKTFDSVKMRVEGTEAEKYVGKKKPNKKEQPAAKPSNWRKKHEEFIETVRYAKAVTQVEKEGGDIRGLQKPPASSNPDYIQCPKCGRKFNEAAGNRHIPVCKENNNRQPVMKAGPGRIPVATGRR